MPLEDVKTSTFPLSISKIKTKNQNIKFYALLAVTAIAVYANTFNHGFVLDDDVVYLKNRFVQQGVQGIPDIVSHGFLYGFNQKNDQSYRPLVLINFAVTKSIFGNNPKAHHRLNVFYYVILCCLIFWLLYIFFQGHKPWLLFWMSLLFVLHPIHTEVVANIKGRDDIMHAIFLALSFICAFKYIDQKRRLYLVIALISYFFALISKEIAITFIVLLPLSVWTFRNYSFKEMGRITAFFLAPFLVYLLLRNAILDTITFEEKMKVINNGLAAANSYSDRLATNFYIFWNYIKLLLVPHPLAWDYSYPHFPILSFSNPKVILIVLLSLTAVIWGIIRLKTKNVFAYCLFFFLISFSLVSNFFILIGSTLGERFLFIPSIAYCIMLVLLIEKGISLIKGRQKNNLLVITVLSIACLYAFKTVDRNAEWATNEELFISGAIATPNNSRAISALGTVYRERGEKSRNQNEQMENYNKAIESYMKSVELYPENTNSLYNLGVIYMNTNQNDKAKKVLQSVFAIDPNHITSRNNLGVLFFREGNYFEAEKHFLACLKINAQFQSAHANLGAVYHNLGDPVSAEKYYRSALQLNPNDQNTLVNLNKLLANGN